MKLSLKIAQKAKITFLYHCVSFLNKNKFYSWRHNFLRFLRNQLPRHFFIFFCFFAKADTKNIDMPGEKPQMLHW